MRKFSELNFVHRTSHAMEIKKQIQIIQNIYHVYTYLSGFITILSDDVSMQTHLLKYMYKFLQILHTTIHVVLVYCSPAFLGGL